MESPFGVRRRLSKLRAKVQPQAYNERLFAASSNGDEQEVARLLKTRPANANYAAPEERSVVRDGWSCYERISPLHIAAERGHEHVAALLLAHGASVNCSMRRTQQGSWNVEGRRHHNVKPLHLAAEAMRRRVPGSEAIGQLLVLHGADGGAKYEWEHTTHAQPAGVAGRTTALSVLGAERAPQWLQYPEDYVRRSTALELLKCIELFKAARATLNSSSDNFIGVEMDTDWDGITTAVYCTSEPGDTVVEKMCKSLPSNLVQRICQMASVDSSSVPARGVSNPVLPLPIPSAPPEAEVCGCQHQSSSEVSGSVLAASDRLWWMQVGWAECADPYVGSSSALDCGSLLLPSVPCGVLPPYSPSIRAECEQQRRANEGEAQWVPMSYSL